MTITVNDGCQMILDLTFFIVYVMCEMCHFVAGEELLTWVAAAMSSTENIWDGAEVNIQREKKLLMFNM